MRYWLISCLGRPRGKTARAAYLWRVWMRCALITLAVGYGTGHASDREALLAAIASYPAEDTPRLAYADWLEEHGEAARAHFIRLHLELARANTYVASFLYDLSLSFLRDHKSEWLPPGLDDISGLISWERGFPSVLRLSYRVLSDPKYRKGLDQFEVPPALCIEFPSVSEAREAFIRELSHLPLLARTRAVSLPEMTVAEMRAIAPLLKNVRYLTLENVWDLRNLGPAFDSHLPSQLVRLDLRRVPGAATAARHLAFLRLTSSGDFPALEEIHLSEASMRDVLGEPISLNGNVNLPRLRHLTLPHFSPDLFRFVETDSFLRLQSLSIRGDGIEGTQADAEALAAHIATQPHHLIRLTISPLATLPTQVELQLKKNLETADCWDLLRPESTY